MSRVRQKSLSIGEGHLGRKVSLGGAESILERKGKIRVEYKGCSYHYADKKSQWGLREISYDFHSALSFTFIPQLYQK